MESRRGRKGRDVFLDPGTNERFFGEEVEVGRGYLFLPDLSYLPLI